MMSSTPNSKKPLVGPGSSPDKADASSIALELTPAENVWIRKGESNGYMPGRNSIVRKFGDQVEIKVYLTPDEKFKATCDEQDDSSSGSSDPSNSSWTKLINMHVRMETTLSKNRDVIVKVAQLCLAALYLAYFIWAMVLDWQRAIPLIVFTSLIFLYLVFKVARSTVGGQIQAGLKRGSQSVEIQWHILKWIVYPLLICAVFGVIAYRVWDRPQNLISACGILFFIFFLFIFSKSPTQVNWRPVLWGLGLQFVLAIFIQWQPGYQVFKFLGDEVLVFLGYTDKGADFVFGPKLNDHMFAFKVLPVIVFFSCAISVLYYIGIMQKVIGSIAWVMRKTLGTTAAESLSAAGNIFVGQTEAPILIRPYLELMTRSELHAVMTGGFATIAGGVLAAYIMFGVPAEHLLCASVMNAPCALAVSKLFYPETEQSRLAKAKDLPKQAKTEKNILEAAASGASASIMLVANVAANLIAFLALLAFVNATLGWIGSMVDYPKLSFELICSYVFMPVAFLMGVDWEDAGIVGELIGTKTFLNEFVAYKDLSTYISNRKLGLEPAISVRSEVIATYALCGFANLSSIGIQLGGIGPMAPNRKGDLAAIALRALTGGIITCLLTACIAGLLIVQDPVTILSISGTNTTKVFNITTIINATATTLL